MVNHKKNGVLDFIISLKEIDIHVYGTGIQCGGNILVTEKLRVRNLQRNDSYQEFKVKTAFLKD